MKTQIDIVAEAFENLAKAVDNAPYNEEIALSIADLRAELAELGANIQR